MPTIFDLLYREYCRARLAEMRKQLLMRCESQEIPELNCDDDGLLIGHLGGKRDKPTTVGKFRVSRDRHPANARE
jgi:hypothetical protein